MTSRRRRWIERTLAGVALAGVLGVATYLVGSTARRDFERRSSPASENPGSGGVASVSPLPPGPSGLALPKKLGSVRFAVMGDTGRGDRAQYRHRE